MKADIESLPELEVKCRECDGYGRIIEYRGDSGCKCPECRGSGFIPTAIGEQILALVRHDLASRGRGGIA